MTAETAVSKLCLFTRFVEISNIVKYEYVKSTLLGIVMKAHNNALNLYLGHALRLLNHRAREICISAFI